MKLADNHNAEETCLNNLAKQANNKHAPESIKSVAPQQVLVTEANINDHDEDSFPEGGLRAWLVVAGAFSAQFMVFGIVNSTGAFQSYLSLNQLRNSSAEQIAWIFSLELFLVFFCGIYVGSIFDRHGPHLLVATGSLAIVLSMMLLGLCTEYWHFILDYAVLGGLGGALLNVPSYACIGEFFDRRRALATGIAVTSDSVGGIVIPLMLQHLLPRIGFAWSTRVLGFLFLAMTVPANLFIKTRVPRATKAPSVIPDLSAFKNLSFALCTAGVFLMEWALFVPLTYITSYVTTHGQKVSFGFTILALLNAGSFFGRWVPGLFADHYGRFNTIMITIAACAVTVLAMWLPAKDSKPLIIAFAIVFGFASGGNLVLIPACLGQLCEVKDYARYFSTAYTFVSFGVRDRTLTSIPIGGSLLHETTANYRGLILFAGLAYTGALCCFTASRVVAVGWGPTTKF